MSASTPPAPETLRTPDKKVRGIVSGVILLAASAVVYLSVFPMPPRFDREPHRELGRILGEESLKLRNAGSRLILICRDTQEFKAPASAAQLEGFHRALKKAGAKVAVTHVLKIDPLRVIGVPPGDFFELLRKSSDNDVIVSFFGPPTLNRDQLASLGDKRPRVLAVCSGSMPQQINLQRLFDQKLLHVAVISRPDPTPAGPGAAGAQAGFDRMFKLITPANAAELASRAEARP